MLAKTFESMSMERQNFPGKVDKWFFCLFKSGFSQLKEGMYIDSEKPNLNKQKDHLSTTLSI